MSVMQEAEVQKRQVVEYDQRGRRTRSRVDVRLMLDATSFQRIVLVLAAGRGLPLSTRILSEHNHH